MHKFIITILFTAFIIACSKPAAVKKAAIIPEPSTLKYSEGSFKLSNQTQLLISDKDKFANEVSFLQSVIESTIGAKLPTTEQSNKLIIINDDKITSSEAYEITINENEIKLTASDSKGIFYAIETLRQLLLASSNKKMQTKAFSYLSYPLKINQSTVGGECIWMFLVIFSPLIS